jgi:hypothetical protein
MIDGAKDQGIFAPSAVEARRQLGLIGYPMPDGTTHPANGKLAVLIPHENAITWELVAVWSTYGIPRHNKPGDRDRTLDPVSRQSICA